MASRSNALWTLGALAISAALFYLGTGNAPIAVLAFVAPLPVLLLAPRVGARRAAGVAFLAFLLGTANNWGYYFAPRDSAAIPLPMALNITIGVSVVFALVVLLFRGLAIRRFALFATLATPAAWVTAVYLASVLQGGQDMTSLTSSQSDVPLVLQVATVTGSLGVEYLVLFLPAGIAALFVPGVTTPARLRTAAVTALVLVATLGYGAVRLSGTGETQPSERVAVVARGQGHWGTDVASSSGARLVESYADAISSLPRGVDIAVLPEAGFGVDEGSLTALVDPMRKVARDRGVDIVIGVEQRSGDSVFNSAVTVPSGDGEPGTYHKQHTSFGGGAAGGKFTPGGEDGFLPGRDGRVGVQICQDMNYSAESADYATAGARMMAVPASDEEVDGWFHGRMAMLRGVEHGFSVAWSAQRGAPAISDAQGRVLAEARTADTGSFATATADVPLGQGATLYTLLGDWFAWLCVAVTLGAVVALVAVGVRGRRTPTRRTGDTRRSAVDQAGADHDAPRVPR